MGAYVQLPGVRMWYETEGAGDPLLLLHGGLSTHETRGPQRADLAAGYRLFLPERRGHGHTPDVEGALSYQDMADDTAAFIESVVQGPAQGQPGGWAGLIQTRPDGTVLRALSPLYGVETGALPASIMDDYINRVWQKYATSTLTVTPFADQPGTKYYGRVSGGLMRFTNGSGAVVTSFEKPDASSVFGCHRRLDAPNDLVRGPISRTLCAGFNRSTLLVNPDQPDSGSAAFYQDPVTNHYARVIHAQMADGKAYAFAFDDVGHHESLVHDGNPRQAHLTLNPFD